jgi:hypothetical protein
VVREVKEVTDQEIIDYYDNNKISIRSLSRILGVSSTRCSSVIRSSNSEKYKIQSAKYGSVVPWNKGKTKENNEILRDSVKKQSLARRTHYTKDGYAKIFNEDLNKAVKIHDHVWYVNTGHWPNSKIGEQVHHIDGDINNNAFDNLLLTTVADHSAIHKEYEKVFFALYRAGHVKLDKDFRRIDWESFNQLIEKLSELV